LENFANWLKSSDHYPILIIDEGQNLVLDSLKTLHYLMTNVSDRLHMTIILCGQEEMVERINRFPAMESRLFGAFLSALTRQEAQKMMEFRWKVASENEDSPLPFTEKAVDEIFKHSKGVPRAICKLSDVALLAAYRLHKNEVDDAQVQMVINALTKKKEKEE
jgi:type II secretory pathway predicted ATPase ExeA